MTETPRDRVLEALSGRPPEEVPVAVFSQSATIGQMRRCGAHFPEAHADPERMALLGSMQAEMFGFESVRVPFCMTGEAEALGCVVKLGSDTVTPTVFSRPADMDPFNGAFPEPPDLSVDEYVKGRMLTTIEAVRILAKRWGGTHPVIAGAVAPLTLAGQVVGAEGMVMSTIMNPGAVKGWAKALDRLQRGYLEMLSDAGADIVFMPDGSASPNMIEPSMYWDLAGSNTTCVKDLGDAKTILHICGSSMPLVEDMLRTGADALSLEASVDPRDLVWKVDGRCALVGSVDPVGTLMQGTPGDVAAEARMCEEAGFEAVAPGCGVSIQTPDGNMRALAAYRGI